jgi:UDP-GlcNAc3NAcA epimerase
MKKITCIIGTRPQLIKHSALLNELEKSFAVTTINTLQHYQYELNDLLSEELFQKKQFFNIEMPHNLMPAERLGKMIIEINNVVNSNKPDCILVYGDTDTTLAGALAVNKNNIKLVHIEAGERSYNKNMPEEHNRVITDYLSNIHFCASQKAVENLKKENITEHVFYTGDLMKDVFLDFVTRPTSPPAENYFFCTIHRNYNKDNPKKLKDLFDTLNALPKKIIFSIHPATLKSLEINGINIKDYENIQVLPPLSYKQSISYQKFSDAVITDSGGIQKEAYWLKRPCITIRKESEWTETLKGNWNRLVYDNLSELDQMIKTMPDNKQYNEDLYGDGKAATTITNILSQLI